jgi:hypothetical protein
MSERKVEGKIEKIQRSKINPEGALLISGSKPGKYNRNCSYCGIYGHKKPLCATKDLNLEAKKERKGNE